MSSPGGCPGIIHYRLPPPPSWNFGARTRQLRALSRISVFHPFHRIDRHASDPNFPVQVRPSNATRTAHLADLLAGHDLIAGLDFELGLMEIEGEHAPTMIDDGRVAPDGKRSIEHDLAGRGRQGVPTPPKKSNPVW